MCCGVGRDPGGSSDALRPLVMVSADTRGREGKRARHADRLPSATSCLCCPSRVMGLDGIRRDPRGRAACFLAGSAVWGSALLPVAGGRQPGVSEHGARRGLRPRGSTRTPPRRPCPAAARVAPSLSASPERARVRCRRPPVPWPFLRFWPVPLPRVAPATVCRGVLLQAEPALECALTPGCFSAHEGGCPALPPSGSPRGGVCAAPRFRLAPAGTAGRPRRDRFLLSPPEREARWSDPTGLRRAALWGRHAVCPDPASPRPHPAAQT